MKTRIASYLWYLFFIYQFFVPWCESIHNLTSLHNYFMLKNLTTKSALAFIKNLTGIDDIRTCIVSLTSVDNITCVNIKETDPDEFGSDVMDSLPDQYPVAFQENEDINLPLTKQFFESVMDQNNVAEIYDDLNENMDNRTLVDTPSEEDSIQEIIGRFSKYLEKSGKLSLKTLAYKVKNLVNPTLYLNHILKVPKYFAELKKYSNFILAKKIRCEIDQQFIICDMLETSIRIFGKASEEICGVIVQQGNITLSPNQTDEIEKAIGLAVNVEKKEAFKYLCENTYVCRRYPAYSDYVVKLLKSILRLQEKYFDIIVVIIEDTIRAKTEFFKSIMGDKMAFNMTVELESIADDHSEVSFIMTAIIKIIMHRYKVLYTNGVEISNNTKAVRILIDIIDVTFHIPDANILGNDFRRVINCINDWGRGKKRRLERVLLNFLYDAVDFLDLYWNHEIRQEVKVLIQYMMKETSENEALRDILFTSGSRLGTDKHVIYTEEEEFNVI